MVSVGVVDEPVNQAYDVISTGALILNLAASILLTFDNITAVYGGLLLTIEQVTVLFFGIDYVLRLITANYLYPESNERDSLIRYIFSAAGIIVTDVASIAASGICTGICFAIVAITGIAGKCRMVGSSDCDY